MPATGNPLRVASLLPATFIGLGACLAVVIGLLFTFWWWPDAFWGVSFLETLREVKGSTDMAFGLAASWAVAGALACAIGVARLRSRPCDGASRLPTSVALAFGLACMRSWLVGLVVGTVMYDVFPRPPEVSPVWILAGGGFVAVVCALISDVTKRSSKAGRYRILRNLGAALGHKEGDG